MLGGDGATTETYAAYVAGRSDGSNDADGPSSSILRRASEEGEPAQEPVEHAWLLGVGDDAFADHLDLGVGDLGGEHGVDPGHVIGPHDAADGDDLGLVVDDHG